MKYLVVDLPCTEDELKTAFREAARRMHPDMGGDPKHFIEMQKEYQTLLANPHTFTMPSAQTRTASGIPLSALGLGLGPLKNGKPCWKCKSKGYERTAQSRYDICPTCNNRRVLRWYCRECGGDGRVVVSVPCIDICYTCEGTGETEVWNPVLPKGRLR